MLLCVSLFCLRLRAYLPFIYLYEVLFGKRLHATFHEARACA